MKWIIMKSSDVRADVTKRRDVIMEQDNSSMMGSLPSVAICDYVRYIAQVISKPYYSFRIA